MATLNYKGWRAHRWKALDRWAWRRRHGLTDKPFRW